MEIALTRLGAGERCEDAEVIDMARPSSQTPENPNQNTQTGPATDEALVDPRDLVQKGGYTKPTEEVVDHPAVTPPMMDDSNPSETWAYPQAGDQDEAGWLL